MTAFDFAVIAIIAFSVLLGWWRGFMYELFSLIGWIVSYIVAVTFTAHATPYIPETVGSESIRSGVAFAALFVATLVVSGIAAWLLAKLAKFAGLAGLDGKFGAMFGVVRGLLVVLALVWLGGLTKLPQQPWWRDAWTSKPLLQAALFAKDYLPDESLQK